MGMKTENNEQMEKIKEHMLQHANDWDYADWLLSQIMDDILSKDSVDLIKAGFKFHKLAEHIGMCKNAENALLDCLSALVDDARKKKEDE